MVLLTMIARQQDGLALAASVQDDEEVGKYLLLRFIAINVFDCFHR